MAELLLNEAQRRAVGVRLRAVSDAVGMLRQAGLDGDRLDAIERMAEDAVAAASVPPPLPQPSLVPALVAEILIAAAEIRPDHLLRYGAVDAGSAQRLELFSTRLTELTDALELSEPAVEEHARTSATDPGSAFEVVPITVALPGREPIELAHLVLDVNGTLCDGGVLIDGVAERMAQLRARLEVTIASADTLGTATAVAESLGVRALVVESGADKATLVDRLGARRCVAIGNGANDAAMLGRAALGIAIVGPEGASPPALAAAQIVCRSIVDALDLLLDPRRLVATLRS